jgi:hypothetical protein
MKKAIFAVLFAATLASCTQNQMAKKFGGTATVNLPKGEKLVNVTWKENGDLWYLTHPMKVNDTPETYTFTQDKGSIISLSGNGKVIINESK